MIANCPHCGEPTDAGAEPDGGESQTLIEDCVVCCRPIQFTFRWSDEEGDFRLTGTRRA